jgi:membrane fusion protein, multidrug efflux system
LALPLSNSHKFEFSFLKGNLMVPFGHPLIFRTCEATAAVNQEEDMRRRWFLSLAACIFVLGGLLTWRIAVSAATTGNENTQHRLAPAIPVTIGTAQREDAPVYLDGLGTVQAYNTVTVNTRVDGQLEKVDFKQGQDVKAGDVLAQIDPRPFEAALDLAKATKAKDQSQLENAKLDLQRYQKGGPLANTEQQIDTQGALVKQLEAIVQADQANIEAAQVQLDYTAISAPLSGRTGIRLVDQGNIVHAASTTGLVVITQLQPIYVQFTLPQDQLQEVMQQMRVSKTPLPVVAQGRDDQRQLATGTLTFVDNQIDPSTGSVRLRATFLNENYALWPGQYVNVRLQLETLPQVVTVPSTAVQRGPNGMYVYVVKPDSIVTMQPVSVGQMSGGTAVIENGLAAGNSIVVGGQYRLQPGSRVQSAGTGADSDGHLANVQ